MTHSLKRGIQPALGERVSCSGAFASGSETGEGSLADLGMVVAGLPRHRSLIRRRNDEGDYERCEDLA